MTEVQEGVIRAKRGPNNAGITIGGYVVVAVMGLLVVIVSMFQCQVAECNREVVVLRERGFDREARVRVLEASNQRIEESLLRIEAAIEDIKERERSR